MRYEKFGKRLTMNEPNPGLPRLMVNASQGWRLRIKGDTPMTKIRTAYRTGIFAALILAIGGLGLASPAQAGGANTQCTSTLAQYGATIKQLEIFSAKAQALADQNPLYISDVEYYASVLADAQRCAKNLSTMATVSR
jgi:hypothetical protein